MRIQFEGAVYHVTARGNEKKDIFFDVSDMRLFMRVLGYAVRRFNWLIHAYCLMKNHYHLLLETPDANLSSGMRHLNGVYAQRFNKIRERVGHLFQGRFKSFLIEKQSYLLEVARYTITNPVRAGYVTNPEDWLFSSYRATTGLEQAPRLLHVDWILSQFGHKKTTARSRYMAFVEEGIHAESPFKKAKGGWILGEEGFLRKVEILMEERALKDVEEHPRRQRFAIRPDLNTIFSEGKARDEGIYLAVHQHGYKLREVGEFLNIHYSWVGKIARKEAIRKELNP
jgi:REP element-mobilizing transposase RayT